jgi:Xaa-Pro aminopeptidase
MASMDFPADRRLAVPSAKAITTPTFITWLTKGPSELERLGHGIGLTTHEPPYMVEGETHPIEPGTCFSIEPGVYLPGRFGVRIEDILLATRTAASA